ncbi:hypothetical protein MIDIC_280009 [Alphaproteobacteria bacterium]
MTRSIVPQIVRNSSYQIGEEVNIKISINNTLNSACEMFSPTFGSFNQLGRSVFVVKLNNMPVPYEGALALSYIPIKLEPGTVFDFEVKLAKEYLMTIGGTYNIIYSDSCFEGNNVYPIISQIAGINVNSATSHSPISVYSVDYKMKYYDASQISQKKNATLTFINASPKEQNDTQTAHYQALVALENIIDHSNEKYWYFFGDYSYLSIYDKNYKDLFCVTHSKSRSDLLSKYDATYKFLATGAEYIFHDRACAHNVYAFVYPTHKDNKIYLCNQYDRSSISPSPTDKIDTKMGTIIHEASHKAAGTQDHFYTFNNCKLHAKTCDPKNVENADCIEYYAELNYLDPSTSSLGTLWYLVAGIGGVITVGVLAHHYYHEHIHIA